MQSIVNLRKRSSGTVELLGENIDKLGTSKIYNKGLVLLSEDRKKSGLFLDYSIAENTSSTYLDLITNGIILSKKKEMELARDKIAELNTKAEGPKQVVGRLSGGNQQKVVLAKWIMANPKVLILDEPTRGVDVGAKSDIHSLMCEFAAKGMAVIMISSELPEVMGMSDRILVYHEGTINGIVDRSEILANNITQKEMLEMAFAQNR